MDRAAAADENLQTLRAAPALAGIAEAELRPLARSAERRRLAPGDLLFEPGQPPDVLFVVARGVIRVSSLSGRIRTPLAVLGPGDLLGDADTGRSPAGPWGARALTEATVLQVPGRALRTFLLRQPARVAGRGSPERRGGTARQRSAAAVAGLGDLVAVHSPKGGAGVTTVALAAAGVLAARGEGGVAVLDLALPFNACAAASGMAAESSLARAVGMPPEHFEDAVLSAVTRHDGLELLAGSLDPAEGELLTPGAVARAIAVLRREFRHIVLDAGSDLRLVPSELLGGDRLLLVAPPSVAALGNLLHRRAELPLPPARVRVLLNQTAPQAWIDRRTAEAVLDVRPVAELPFDRPSADLFARGRLTPERAAGGRLGKALETVLDQVLPAARAPSPAPGRNTGRHRRWNLG